MLCKLYHSFAYKQKGKCKVHEEGTKSDRGVQDLSIDDDRKTCDIEANKPNKGVDNCNVNICNIEDSKPDGGLQDQSADDYNVHICDIEDSKPDEGMQEPSLNGYNICDIEASKPDGGVQDLSVDDYGICDIDFAATYADPSSEEMHEHNIGEI